MTARFCQQILSFLGWSIQPKPMPDSCILIVYPHTSNWDFVLGILTKQAIGIHSHWLGKKELFWWPATIMMKALGGIAVDRKNPEGLIEKLTTEFQQNQNFILTITPEGTRSYRPFWKSGFYRIALATRAPLVMVSMDYVNKTIGFSEPVAITGNLDEDLTAISTFYQGVVGRHPRLASPILLNNPFDHPTSIRRKP